MELLLLALGTAHIAHLERGRGQHKVFFQSLESAYGECRRGPVVEFVETGPPLQTLPGIRVIFDQCIKGAVVGPVETVVLQSADHLGHVFRYDRDAVVTDDAGDGMLLTYPVYADMIAVLQIVQVIRRGLVFEARVDEQEGALVHVPRPADDVQHHVTVLTSAYADEGMFVGCEDVGARQKGIIRE